MLSVFFCKDQNVKMEENEDDAVDTKMDEQDLSDSEEEETLILENADNAKVEKPKSTNVSTNNNVAPDFATDLSAALKPTKKVRKK